MGKKKRDKKKTAPTGNTQSAAVSPSVEKGTRGLAGVLLAVLALMVGGILAVLENIKVVLLRQ